MFLRFSLIFIISFSLLSCSSSTNRRPASFGVFNNCKNAINSIFSKNISKKYSKSQNFKDQLLGGLHQSQILETKLRRLQGRPVIEIENDLKNLSIEDEVKDGLGNSGSTKPKLLILEGGIKGVWKPHKRIKLSNYRAEVLAYELDMKFGFNLVPPTVERTINEEVGSLQLYIEGTTSGPLLNYYKKSISDDMIKQVDHDIRKQSLFDFLIENNDRNVNNFLISNDSKIVSIDNASSFTGHGFKTKSFESRKDDILNFLTTGDGRKIIEKIRKSQNSLFEKEIIDYLGKDDASRFFDRVEVILELYDSHF